MKKLIEIVLSAVICVALAACGSSSSSAASAGEGNTVDATYTFQEMVSFNGMNFETPWTLELKSDGTYSLTSEDMMGKTTVTGTYTMTDDTHVTTGTPTQKGFAPQATFFNDDLSCDWTLNSDTTAKPDKYEGETVADGAVPQEDGTVNIGGTAGDFASSYQGTKILDEAYASVSDSETLDLFLPENPAEGNPVVVMIHGGAFRMGDKEMTAVSDCFQTLLDNGYAVATVNYRFSSEAVFPACVADVKAAVRWLKANAEQYSISSENIYVWGESAGAYLANMAAETADVSEFDGDVKDNANQSSEVKAVVSFFAPVDFYDMDADFETLGVTEDQRPMGLTSTDNSAESMLLGQNVGKDKAFTDKVSPLTYIPDMTASTMYAFIEHGDSDVNVPYLQSQRLYDALADKFGTETITLKLLEGAAHEDAAFYTEENLRLVIDFLDSVPRV